MDIRNIIFFSGIKKNSKPRLFDWPILSNLRSWMPAFHPCAIEIIRSHQSEIYMNDVYMIST